MLPSNTILQNRYHIIEQIGRGGMGAVYKATDTRLRATVALKQTLVDDPALSKAFEREAQLLASLRHTMLPRVSDHFLDDHGQFLVMEYIPGDDLGVSLEHRKQSFDVADVLRWADQLLDVLTYLHTHNPPVIHRDIKPQNIKLTDRNEIILLDFGLAKGSSLQTKATSTGSIFGYTPHYAPLEQIHGTGTDHRSDLYSLAATLYHLSTGRMPVDAMSRATAKVNDEIDPLVLASDVNPNVPPAVAMLLDQAMSQKASQRPPTAAAMRIALRDAGQNLTLADNNIKTVVHVPDERSTIADTALATHLAGASPSKAQLAPAASTAVGPTKTGAHRRPVLRHWWIWAAVAILVALVGGMSVLLATNASSLLSQPTATSAPIVAVVPTSTSTPTDAPTPTIDILKAAGGTQTAIALAAAATTTAFANIVNIADTTRTAVSAISATAAAGTEQASLATANAETATQAALATASAQAAQATADADATAQSIFLQQTEAARPAPTSTRRPTPRPTRTPAPPTPVPEARAECRVQGGGSKFIGSCSPGNRLNGQTGSCITGRVVASDGSTFKTVLLSVDNKGHTIRVPIDGGSYNPDNGAYSICKLGAGEWGVTVINVNRGNGIEENPSQAASQVIVRLSGADGEHAIVSFRE